jgi:hypothetical protein
MKLIGEINDYKAQASILALQSMTSIENPRCPHLEKIS